MNGSSPPNLFVVGAMKAGTTALVDFLCQHPQIFCPDIKEPNYYCRELHERGIRKRHPFTRGFNLRRYLDKPKRPTRFFDYIERFEDYLRLYDRRGNQRYAIDGSTTYLNSPKAARAISQHSPQAKIIILLRDPAARAWSEFIMNQRIGFADRSFKNALEREAQDLRAGRAPLFERYASCGQYDVHIARFVEIFGSASVLVADIVSLQDPSFYDQLWSFLDLDPIEVQIERVNEGINPRLAWMNRLGHKTGLKYRVARWIPLGVRTRLRRLLYKDAQQIMTKSDETIFSQYFAEAAITCGNDQSGIAGVGNKHPEP